ncbi:MAG TPA: DUF899 domain-containing protein [Verrucomicrobiae bacterium]|jgi:predicted dithiol-disulfide oxidoreductase (DUF899 family)|nr:DUF899 domain-containing protein [Verrucomicrobiae bacterium]
MKTKSKKSTALPAIVPRAIWKKARQKLLVKEKQLTRALDKLAAERRRLPMTPVAENYAFKNTAGEANLLDLFEGRRQLVIYHHMWLGAPDYCSGCASIVDNFPRLEHLHARNTSLVQVSDGPWSEIKAFQKRMGWTLPWYSSQGTTFNRDCGVEEGSFGLSIFLRADDSVFQTYFTTSRGVDRLRFDFNLLDLTPLGRQETWEDSPKGWPQTPPYKWWRLHDEYEQTPKRKRA